MINFNNTQLLGHRGARSERLENTLAGFQHARTLQPYGLVGVEFDVQLTADGHLLVFHDDTLERLCGLQSRIDQMSLSQLQRQQQHGHPILSLPELAEVLSSFDYIELEIKTHARTNLKLLVQALTRDLLNTPLVQLPLVLTSFDRQLLAALQRNKSLNNFPRALLARTPQGLKNATNTALQLGCRRLGVYYPLLTHAVIKHIHRYGLPVSAWTVNDSSAIKQLIKWQVDTIITDIPSQLLLG